MHLVQNTDSNGCADSSCRNRNTGKSPNSARAACTLCERGLDTVVRDQSPETDATADPNVTCTRDYRTYTRRFEMRSLAKKFVNFLKREDGPTAVEYAVMLALIIVVCIAAITTLGSNANNTFSNVASKATPAGGS